MSEDQHQIDTPKSAWQLAWLASMWGDTHPQMVDHWIGNFLKQQEALKRRSGEQASKPEIDP